jgi:hypothetical protein
MVMMVMSDDDDGSDGGGGGDDGDNDDDDDSCFCPIVAAAVQLVSKAKKPLVILGSQSTLPPAPAEKLKSALEVQNKHFCCPPSKSSFDNLVSFLQHVIFHCVTYIYSFT